MTMERDVAEPMDKTSGGDTAMPSTQDTRSRVRSSVRRPRRSLVVPLAALLLLILSLGAWAVASPVGSSPDEDYHLGSIWCAQGERDGACLTDGETFAIPQEVNKTNCFALQETVSAGCQYAFLVNGKEFVETPRGNFGEHAGDYPPGFYATMSLFVGPDFERSVIIMRLVNVLIYAGLLTALYVVSSVRMRRAVVATACVTLVPLGMFIIPSVNPSSWSVISGATLFFGVFGFMTAKDRNRLVTFGAISAVSLVLAAQSRADSAVYAVIAIGAATLVALSVSTWTRWTAVRLILPVGLATIAALSFLSAGQNDAAGQGVYRGPTGFLFVFLDIFRYWAGSLGYSPLGWLDTDMPSIVWMGMIAAFCAVVFVAIGRIGWVRGVMVALVALSGAAVPTFIEATANTPSGSVQSRYIYPLVILLAAVATLSTERRAFWLTAVQRWLVVVVVGVANSVALYVNLRRYVTGTDVSRLRLTPAEWWWSNVPLSSEVVCLIGSATFFAALVLASTALVKTRDEAEEIRAAV